MGTSTGKGMPRGGEWTPLKFKATSYAKAGNNGNITPKDLVSHYLKAIGGIDGILNGKGGGRSVSKQVIGKAARKTSLKLGAFLSDFASIGLDGALGNIGLSHLIGKPANDVIAGLLDTFTDAANTLDDHAVRIALSKLLEELFDSVVPYAEIEEILNKSIDEKGLAKLIAIFFGYYIFELFCRDFYEDWLKKVGSNQTNQRLKNIKECIFAEVEATFAKNTDQFPTLKRAEVRKLADQVLQDTIEIFEVK